MGKTVNVVLNIAGKVMSLYFTYRLIEIFVGSPKDRINIVVTKNGRTIMDIGRK